MYAAVINQGQREEGKREKSTVRLFSGYREIMFAEISGNEGKIEDNYVLQREGLEWSLEVRGSQSRKCCMGAGLLLRASNFS